MWIFVIVLVVAFAPRVWLWLFAEPLKRLVKDATLQALDETLHLEAVRAVQENFRHSDKAEEFLSNNVVGGYLKLIVRLGVRQEADHRAAIKKLLNEQTNEMQS